MEITLKPEDVDQLVRDTIVKAGIGKTITEAVHKALTGYNSPVEEQLKAYIGRVARELIEGLYADQIKASVAAEIEKRITKELIDTTVAKAMEKIERAAQDRY